MSQLEVNKINPATGTTLSVGDSGDTITITSGATIGGSGLNLTSLSATQLTSGTIPDSRFPATLPAIDGSALTNLPTETKPTVSSISPSTITNAQTSVTITGTNFVSVPTVDAIFTTGAIVSADEVSYTSATEIVAKFTLTTDGSYYIRVENNDGNAVRSTTSLLLVSDDPVWTTAAGTLGSFAKGASISETVTATGDTVTYAVQSGTLPTGLSLASATGIISGTESSSITENTTYNFTIRATDAQAQYADRAFAMTINVSYDIEYLIVAGGGGGAGASGGGGGGGGAGGYRTGSFTGIAAGDGVLTVSAGGGGARAATADTNDQGSDGADSSVTGSFITDITSTGGGGGGGGGAPFDSKKNGRDGGSGGGGGHNNSTGGSASPVTSPVQGYAGGDESNGYNGGGGGGGASEVGETAPATTSGGDGGDGLQNDITGTNLYYAGGGGGSSNSGAGVGGQGGGGNSGTSGDASQGTDGLGGGGGGAYDARWSARGGGGVVILRMPTADYSGTTSGSPTVTTDGTDTILKWEGDSGTGGGSYTT